MNNKYKEYLKSDKWSEIRKIILSRDNNKCVKCGSSKNLQVHHSTYDNIFNEENNLDDLVTLCKTCHNVEHGFIARKNIIVDNYLKINKELIGCSISLKKSSEISFFLEVCRIKQMEVLAKHNCYCNDFDKNLSINKSKLSNIFNSSTIRKNDRMFALESDGIFFSKVDIENITIIESISFNANNGNFDVEFNESNFIKYFINCVDDNFIKVPTKMFSGLKSKNSSMILLWILKFQDVKGYKFIKPKDLCIILDKNINSIRKDNLKSDLNNALCQLKHIGIYDGIKSDFDKNGSLRLNISPFSVNINVESSTKKIAKKDIRIPTENFSEDEIRIYGGCDE